MPEIGEHNCVYIVHFHVSVIGFSNDCFSKGVTSNLWMAFEGVSEKKVFSTLEWVKRRSLFVPQNELVSTEIAIVGDRHCSFDNSSQDIDTPVNMMTNPQVRFDSSMHYAVIQLRSSFS